MAEPQIMSPQEYGRSVLGYGQGQSIQGKELAKFRDQYSKYVQSASKSFTPSTGMATNAVSQEVTPYFMSSPNSAQPMTERQPVLKPVPGKDGKAYNYNPVTGTYAPAMIEGTTNQFEMDPKSNALADALAQMAGTHGAAAEEPSGIASFFGIGGGAPAASPTPSPTPMPAMAGTNAPVPAATPAAAYSSEQDVMAAARAGQISVEQAQNILVNQFGLDP